MIIRAFVDFRYKSRAFIFLPHVWIIKYIINQIIQHNLYIRKIIHIVKLFHEIMRKGIIHEIIFHGKYLSLYKIIK